MNTTNIEYLLDVLSHDKEEAAFLFQSTLQALDEISVSTDFSAGEKACVLQRLGELSQTLADAYVEFRKRVHLYQGGVS